MKTHSRAKTFSETRKHHSMEIAEDYTELVYDLIESQGEARTGEIAKALGVSHVTALRAIRRVQDQGYLETSPQQPITLTPKGKRLALYSKKRHRLLVDFLIKIGVPPETAEVDIEGAEHHFSKTSLEAIQAFLDRCK